MLANLLRSRNLKAALLRIRPAAGLLLVALLWSWPLSAADESCTTCGGAVSVSGDFAHSKEAPTLAVEGAQADAFREDVNGPNFNVIIRNLPAGTYVVRLRAAETEASQPGERVFDVTVGETVLAKGLDLFTAAGGARKVAAITGVVEKADDALRGPLTLWFVASKGRAKFNTIEVMNTAGETVVSVRASELADIFSAASRLVPEVAEPVTWHDPARPLKARADDLIRRMSLAEKVAQLKNAAPAIPRLGLPAYDYWNEALHGVANNGAATVFPQAIGGAASWNPALFREEGRIIGVESRAKHNDYATKHGGDSKWWTGLTFWTPNVNIFRDPRWGRGQETYGEDPYLTGEIGVEFVKGIQGDDPRYMLAMACAKHFAVHSGPEPARHRFDAVVSARDLYETYLPQFERVVREGKVAGVMSAYNAINGTPVSASSFLLDDLLRKQWGFDGYVVSDCDAIRDIYGEQQHRFVKTAEEAAALAVRAGCNLCCGGDYNALVRALQQGLVTEPEIDQALYRTLWTRFRLGLFDPVAQVPFNRYTIADNDTPEHGHVALALARQSLVLLKNDGLLPLDRSKYKRLAVIGPNGDSKSMLEGSYHGSASKPVSILNGIRQVAGKDIDVTSALGSPVTTKPGSAPWSGQDNATKRPFAELKAEALALAANADLIVYVGGITPAQEGESFDRDSIELPPEQADLVKALHATGKPVVMVNCSGSAMALPWEAENLPAILQAWYPGQNGGLAVAEVLFGEINPSGHLPITFYRATADLPSFTDYSMKGRTYRYFEGKPLWAFGHGLSYTTFEYARGRLAEKKIATDGTVKATLTVTNTGTRDGEDVVQVYYRHVNSQVPQPKLALCGFGRVSLKKGSSQKVTVEVPAARLRYWDEAAKQYVVEPGAYELLIGAASDDIRLTLPFTIAAR
jgi:beta-glucosidase